MSEAFTNSPGKLISFSVSKSYSPRFSGYSYSVTLKDDGTVRIALNEDFPNEKIIKTKDQQILRDLEALIEQYKMDRFKGQYTPKFEVYDGYMWGLSYSFSDGKSISGSGSNAMPEDSREAFEALVSYFEKWMGVEVPKKEIASLRFTVVGEDDNLDYKADRGKNGATITLVNKEHQHKGTYKITNEKLDEFQTGIITAKMVKDESMSNLEMYKNRYSYQICYVDGESVTREGGYGSYGDMKSNEFKNFFEVWLPLRGKLTKVNFHWTNPETTTYHIDAGKLVDGKAELSFVTPGQIRFSTCPVDMEYIDKIQELIDKYGFDNSYEGLAGQGTKGSWHLEGDYDSGDHLRVSGYLKGNKGSEKEEAFRQEMDSLFAPVIEAARAAVKKTDPVPAPAPEKKKWWQFWKN